MMKKFIKIIVIVILLPIIAFVFLHLLINLKGRDFLSKALPKALGRSVKIGSVESSLPFNIHIKNFKAEGLFKVEEIRASIFAPAIFTGNFNVLELKLIRPQADIEISSGKESLSEASVSKEEHKEEYPQKKFVMPRLKIGRLLIKEGVVNLNDKISQDKNLLVSIKDINASIDNLNFTGIGSQVTNFRLSAKVPWQKDSYEGLIEAGGWVDLFKKDIKAIFKIKDIDGVYLHSYYSKWVDLEKARIEKARLNFSSEIEGLDNDVTANCHLELTDIVRRARLEDEPKEKAEKITDALLDIFRSLNEGKIVLDFKIKTKLDYPRFGFNDIRQAVEREVNRSRTGISVSLEKIALLPANLIRATAKGITGMFRAAIDGLFATGKVFSDTVSTNEQELNKTKQNP